MISGWDCSIEVKSARILIMRSRSFSFSWGAHVDAVLLERGFAVFAVLERAELHVAGRRRAWLAGSSSRLARPHASAPS